MARAGQVDLQVANMYLGEKGKAKATVEHFKVGRSTSSNVFLITGSLQRPRRERLGHGKSETSF